jgi:hypothetical protein
MPVKYFLKNIIIINIISAVFCVVGTITFTYGLSSIYGIYEYQEDYQIFNFGWFFVKSSNQFLNEIRPAGYYDEPGSFAYVVMFLLLINRKYFKNMTWEYLLLFLPLVTTSLAHLITIIFFVCIYYLNPKNILKLSLFLFFFACTSYLIFSGAFGEEKSSFFKKKLVYRIENVIEGEDKSRQGGFELGPNIFSEHHWGYSSKKVKKEYPDFVNETIWGPLIYFGILGFPFFLLPFIYIMIKSIKNQDKTTLLMLSLVLINLIQRPSYIYPLFVVLLYFLFFHKNVRLKTIELG